MVSLAFEGGNMFYYLLRAVVLNLHLRAKETVVNREGAVKVLAVMQMPGVAVWVVYNRRVVGNVNTTNTRFASAAQFFNREGIDF